MCLVRLFNHADDGPGLVNRYDRVLWVYDANRTIDMNDPLTIARITDSDEPENY